MRTKIITILFGLLFISGCGKLGGGIEVSLKAPKEKILKSELVTDENGKKFVKYDYISAVEVPKFSDKEDLSKRTNNSYTEVTGKKIDNKPVLQTTFYSGAPFIKEGTKWMQTETATATEKVYSDSTKVTLLDKIKGLMGNYAYADTTTTYPNIDTNLYVNLFSNYHTFSDMRTHSGEVSGITTAEYWMVQLTASTTTDLYKTIRRSAFYFNTSFLTSNATIVSSTFYVYFTNNVVDNATFDQKICLTGATSTSDTNFIDADYVLQTPFSDRYSSDLDVGSAAKSRYNLFSLNATGLANIQKTGLTKIGMKLNSDADNSAPTWTSAGDTYAYGYYASRTGVTQDPKLVIEYTTGGTPTPVIPASIIQFE